MQLYTQPLSGYPNTTVTNHYHMHKHHQADMHTYTQHS